MPIPVFFLKQVTYPLWQFRVITRLCSSKKDLTHPLRLNSSTISFLESPLIPSTLGFLRIRMVERKREPQYFGAPPIKRKSLFPSCLNPNWPYELLWPIESCRNDAIWVPEPGSPGALRRLPLSSWNAALRPPSKGTVQPARGWEVVGENQGALVIWSAPPSGATGWF